MFEALGKNAERKHLGFALSLLRSGSVGEDARQFGDLGQPTAVFLAFTLDAELHRAPCG
jgi:hypothetical protein